VNQRTWKDFTLGSPESRPNATWEDRIRVPDHPPLPWFSPPATPQEAERHWALLNQSRMLAHLDWQLVDAAWSLAMLSRQYSGRFTEGMALPELSTAAAAGAIALACAAFEAALDSTAVTLAIQARNAHQEGRARAFELLRSMSPSKRLEALLALLDQPFGWDAEPFQSLALVLSIRKHLLHHEVELYPAVDGFWPSKRLKDLPIRLKSPYLGKPGLEWHQHILTPDGAEWAVRSVHTILEILDLLWHDLDPCWPEHD
jgi:hypothetical protein